MEPFKFEHDMERRFLRLEMTGFWTAEDMANFRRQAAAILQGAVAAGATVGEGRILVLATHLPVQDKNLTEEFSCILPMYGKLAKRIAIVGSPSALQRLQVKRLIGERASVFSCEKDARDWLFEG